MLLGLGRLSLNDLTGGTLTTGKVPLARFSEYVQAQSGAVTVLAAATTIVDAPQIDVVALDVVVVCGYVPVNKGGTGGDITVRLLQTAGTAVGAFLSSRANVTNNIFTPATAWFEATPVSLWVCTSGGTVTFRMEGLSAASNGSVAANAGQIMVWRFYGA